MASSPSASPSESPSASPSTSPSTSPSESPSTSPSASPSASISSSPSPAPASDTLADVLDLMVVGDRIATNFPFEYGTVVTDTSNSALLFVTDLTSSTDSYCVGSYVKFASGDCINQTRRISAYSGVSKAITVASAFTETPAAGDEFYIVNQ